MSFQEKLLLFLSRKPGTNDYERSKGWDIEDAFSILCRVFPNFMETIKGKKILDYGCGTGYQVVTLALNGANFVLGLDINQKALQKGRDLASQFGVEAKVEFCDAFGNNFRDRFDIVISQNSMEHYGDPEKVLNEMKSALRPNGTMLITFGPPWFAPYGGHTYFFTKIPWVNLIFDEKTVMNVRSHFRKDGASKYEEVKGGLNKMSVDKFERLVSDSGMDVQYRKHECVKGMNFMGKLTLVRELLINHVSCMLTKHK